MRTRLLVIGIGIGNPEQMTMQAIGALNRADVVLLPRKGAAKEDLAELRRAICRRFLTNETTRIVEFDMPVRDAGDGYRAGVDAWHAVIADIYRGLLAAHLPSGGSAALLVWGDPSLYDSTLRIVERMRARMPLGLEIIPGITAIQALAASHAMPLNTIGGPVLVTTGRRLREAGVPDDCDTVVVMLDGTMAFQALPADDFEIFWGAYLGFPEEIAIAGPLSSVGATIAERRAEARARHGWIMDIYLLRRIRAG